MSCYKILVIDDNDDFLASVKTALKDFYIETSNSILNAHQKLSVELDAVLLDLVFDESNPEELQGIELLHYIKDTFPDLPVIIMTNYSSTSIAVSTIKNGAEDFLNKKELDWTEWKVRLETYCKRANQIKTLNRENKELISKYSESNIIGQSEEVEYLKRRLEDLAHHSDEASIFITGETGTGKNLAVKYFRNQLLIKNKPFLEFSLSELSETVLESELFGHIKGAFTGAVSDKKGLLKQAENGILFLDEIGDYDLKIQQKIMRFIENKTIIPVGSTKSEKINTQLVMATNQNIPLLIEEGKFRNDLYQRINRVRIEIPPLRERKEDIRILTDYFFNHFKEKEKTNLKIISENVYDIFERYDWPGNIRELQSLILDACTKARLFNDTKLQVKHISKDVIKGKSGGTTDEGFSLREKTWIFELEQIEEALIKFNGNKSEAAAFLKSDLDQVRNKIKKISRERSDLINHFAFIKQYYM
jgi:DNA-binding NtrC family response regulator